MNIKQTIDILREFNDYRRSRGKFADKKATIRDLHYSPKEIGDAINNAIEYLSKLDTFLKEYIFNFNFNDINSCVSEIKPTQSIIGKIGNESVICSKEPFGVMYAQESRTLE